MLEGGTTIVGHSTFRQMLRQRNRHRSAYESPDLREWRKKCGKEEATERILELRQEGAEALSSDAVAKLLYDEYDEEEWGALKSKDCSMSWVSPISSC